MRNKNKSMAAVDGIRPHHLANGGKNIEIPHTSVYTGVTYITKGSTGRWKATIKHQGKKVSLGVYDREDEAARAFDRAALKYRGNNARTNFPQADYAADGAEGSNPASTSNTQNESGSTRKRKHSEDKLAPPVAVLDQPPLITTSAFKPKAPLTDIRPTPINCNPQINPALDKVQKAIAAVMDRPLETFMEVPDDEAEDMRSRQSRALDWCRSQLTQAQQAEAEAVGNGGQISADVQSALQALDGMAGSTRQRQTAGGTGSNAAQGQAAGPPDGPRKYKGVSWVPDKNKFRAQYSRGKDKKSHLGYFLTAEEAAVAYDQAAFAQKGSAAKLNFPDMFQAAQQHGLFYGSGQGGSQQQQQAHTHQSQPEQAPSQPSNPPVKRPRGRPKKDPQAAAHPPKPPPPKNPPAPTRPEPIHVSTLAGKEVKSKYMGVYRTKNGNFRAVIKDSKNNNLKINLGHFETEEEAAQAFDRAAISMRGKAAKTNFHPSIYSDASQYEEEAAAPAQRAPAPTSLPASMSQYQSSFAQPMSQATSHHPQHPHSSSFAQHRPTSSAPHIAASHPQVTALQIQPIHTGGTANSYNYPSGSSGASSAVVYAASTSSAPQQQQQQQQQHGYGYSPGSGSAVQQQYSGYSSGNYGISHGTGAAHGSGAGQQLFENGRGVAQSGAGLQQQYGGSWPYWGRG